MLKFAEPAVMETQTDSTIVPSGFERTLSEKKDDDVIIDSDDEMIHHSVNDATENNNVDSVLASESEESSDFYDYLEVKSNYKPSMKFSNRVKSSDAFSKTDLAQLVWPNKQNPCSITHSPSNEIFTDSLLNNVFEKLKSKVIDYISNIYIIIYTYVKESEDSSDIIRVRVVDK